MPVSRAIRILSLTVAIIFALPLSLGAFTGFYLWLSPYLFLNAALSTRVFSTFHLCGFVLVLILLFQRRRWFCRTLCPTGLLCDAASKISIQRKRPVSFLFIQKPLFLLSMIIAALGVPVLVVLDPINLLYMALDGFSVSISTAVVIKMLPLLGLLLLHIFFPHFWCQRICPLGGMQDYIADSKLFLREIGTGKSVKYLDKRRYFLTGLFGLGCGLAFPPYISRQSRKSLRPPGAVAESRFVTTCARCGNCIKACPTGILHSTIDPYNLVSVLTPKVFFTDAYCLPECIRCGEVCPSGAIHSFTAGQKQHLVIGIARIDLDGCLLRHNRECDRCKAVCAYNAIAMQKEPDGFSTIPVVVKDRCNGCGACKIICPAEAVDIAV